jgi:hypothetical protein
MKNGINNEDRKNYFSRFNGELLAKIIAFKSGNSASRNYRANLDLDKAFIKKLKQFKAQNLTKTDVIEASIVQFVYGDQRKNTLTAKGAITIISKKDSIIAKAAKIAIETEEGLEGFADYITDQCEAGNRTVLEDTHGVDIINAILK